MPTSPLVIDRLFDSSDGRNSVLRLHGPLTAATLSQFQVAFRALTSDTIFIDLTDVPYVDSAGLGGLVSVYISCQKTARRVILAGVNARVAKLFEVTKLQQLFLTFPTLSQALDTVANAGAA
jgi:anti-sigma B factor antagonist